MITKISNDFYIDLEKIILIERAENKTVPVPTGYIYFRNLKNPIFLNDNLIEKIIDKVEELNQIKEDYYRRKYTL